MPIISRTAADEPRGLIVEGREDQRPPRRGDPGLECQMLRHVPDRLIHVEDVRQALRAAPLPANYEVDLLDGSQVKALVPHTLGKAIKFIDSIAVAPAELR